MHWCTYLEGGDRLILSACSVKLPRELAKWGGAGWGQRWWGEGMRVCGPVVRVDSVMGTCQCLRCGGQGLCCSSSPSAAAPCTTPMIGTPPVHTGRPVPMPAAGPSGSVGTRGEVGAMEPDDAILGLAWPGPHRRTIDIEPLICGPGPTPARAPSKAWECD